MAAKYVAHHRRRDVEIDDQLAADAWALQYAVDDGAPVAWEAIKLVVQHYPMSELLAEPEFEDRIEFGPPMNEAQYVVGLLAAGPIEDLLSYHGAHFIEQVEQTACADERMQWALGGVWQLTMTDEFYARVQLAAGEFSTLKRKTGGG
jgi:hypothetical protein